MFECVEHEGEDSFSVEEPVSVTKTTQSRTLFPFFSPPQLLWHVASCTTDADSFQSVNNFSTEHTPEPRFVCHQHSMQ